MMHPKLCAVLVVLGTTAPAALAGQDVIQQAPVPVAPAPVVVPVLAEEPIIVQRQNATNTTEAPRYQYTVRFGDTFQTRAQDRAVGDAQRALAKAQTGDCLVVDRAGRRYLITDPETLTRIKENNAPVRKLGDQMGGVGKLMGDQGKIMGQLGKQMGEIGTQLNAAKEAGDTAKVEDLKRQMRALGDQMRAAGSPMREKGEDMRKLGQQMRIVAQEAETKMMRIIDTAFLKQLAIEQKP
jgi:hypothetical protein